jgi:hypothetical protein
MIIMETLVPEGDDELLAFRLIPLEGPFFSFPSFSFPLETQSLQVPALRIPVAPAEGPESVPSRNEEAPVPEILVPGTKPYPPFPPGVSGFSRRVLEQSRALWEAGQTVEALAEIRRNERDHPAGFTLSAYRRTLEQALGLEGEPAERYSPRVLLVPALVLCLLLAALGFTLPAGLVWFQNNRGGRAEKPGHHGNRLSRVPLRAFRRAGFFFSAAALLCLLQMGFGYQSGVHYHDGRSSRRALARETLVYRVPDDQGTGIARLKEGQGLLVYEVQNGWAYAESLVNGLAGWIKAGTYLVY